MLYFEKHIIFYRRAEYDRQLSQKRWTLFGKAKRTVLSLCLRNKFKKDYFDKDALF